MHTSQMTLKGQITIPVDFRNNLHLSPGDSFKFKQVGDEIVIKKVRKPSFEDLYNCLPKSKRSFTVEEMDEGIARALGAKYAK